MKKELIEKIKECNNKNELDNLLKENNIVLKEEELNKYYSLINEKEISDNELDSVSGGCGEFDRKDSGSTPKFSVGEKVTVENRGEAIITYVSPFKKEFKDDNGKTYNVFTYKCNFKNGSLIDCEFPEYAIIEYVAPDTGTPIIV